MIRKIILIKQELLLLFYELNRSGLLSFFFFNDTATTEIYTLSLHDALPISMEARDPLAHDVQVGGPQAVVAGLRKAGRREVVDQCVEPDVYGLLRVAGKRDAPGLALPRDRDVLEAGLDEAQHLVAADLGLHAQRARADAIEHGVAVRAQPEEVVPLLGRDQLEGGMLDAVPVDDLRAGLELLAPGAVQPRVLRLEQIRGVALPDTLEQGRHRAGVSRLGGADPVVVRAVEAAPIVGEAGRHAIDPRLRRYAGAGGGLDHGLAVLVHPHQEVDVVAAQPVIARDTVGTDLLEGVPQMRLAVRVVDGRRQVELRHPLRRLRLSAFRATPRACRLHRCGA